MADETRTETDQASEVEEFLGSLGSSGQRESSDESQGEEKVTLSEETDNSTPVESEEGTPAETGEAEGDGEVPTSDEHDPQVKLYTVPDHEMYGALRGQKVTAAQLEEAGLIGKVITRDHQEMHNTKLYNELKRDFDARLEEFKKQFEAPKAAEPKAEPVDPRTFGDEIERTYVPQLKKLAEAGSFEPDIVEAYPRFVGHVAHQLESMRLVGAGLVKAVEEMRGWVGNQQNTSAFDRGMAALNGGMDELAKNELYAPLRDPAEREAFLNWMKAEDNPQPWKRMDLETELAHEQNLRGAYAAFKAATGNSAPAPVAASNTRERAKMAAPAAGNARKPKSDEPANEFEQLKADISRSRAAAFGR